jgi:aspartyl-tRNA(Asn)/glutamyl-tRNA(Gln) amidotransferase subunit B
MRTKEAANDYRFFPEPDLQPIKVTKEQIDEIKATMPPLPNELFKKYTDELGLSDYDAGILTDSKSIALFFEEIIAHTSKYKAAANWMMGDIKSYLNEKAIEVKDFPISPENIANLIELIDSGKISNNLAGHKLFPEMITQATTGAASDPEEIAKANDWIQESDEAAIRALLLEVFSENPEEYERFKSGEKQLMGFLMGQLMKKSAGKADPRSATKLINEILNE